MRFNGEVGHPSTLEQVLAASGGTVTGALERLVGEPIDATVRGHRLVAADHADTLEAPDGHPLLCRAATLRGRHSGRAYVEAVSLLVPSRLPPGLGSELESGHQPIGRLLEAAGIGLTREILPGPDPLARSVWPEVAPVPDSVVLARTYRAHAGGPPVMVITEWFLTSLDPFLPVA